MLGCRFFSFFWWRMMINNYKVAVRVWNDFGLLKKMYRRTRLRFPLNPSIAQRVACKRCLNQFGHVCPAYQKRTREISVRPNRIKENCPYYLSVCRVLPYFSTVLFLTIVVRHICYIRTDGTLKEEEYRTWTPPLKKKFLFMKKYVLEYLNQF